MKITSWFFDFDDTLVSAPLTWVLTGAVPKMVAQYGLPFDQTCFDRAMITAQERWNRDDNLMSILGGLFSAMDWALDLRSSFLVDLQTNYQPTLFDDALHLLRGLAQAGHLVYVVSNNVNAPTIARQLGITAYVRDVFTPQRFSDALPKPHVSFWERILEQYPVLGTTTPILVGDDPWTDGAFADACKMKCWLVDRAGRLASMYVASPYSWVRSLRDIPIA
jgi:FMN phosphatase YigB (HAD superfamily)